MKKLFILFLTLGYFTPAYSSDLIDKFDQLQLKVLPVSDAEYNVDFGLIFKRSPFKVYGIYGVKENQEDEILGKMALSSFSIGLISGGLYSDDDTLDISNIEGKELNSLCSRFHGLGLGLTAIAGGDGFSVMNSNGVTLNSTVTTYGLQVNLSYKNIKSLCLELGENLNWNNTVRF